MYATLHIKIWLETENTPLLGQGTVDLLQRVKEMGSLKKAAESLGMSYRGAWGRLKRIEEALGFPLLLATGSRRDGYQLTAESDAFISNFLAWQEKIYAYALQEAPQHAFLRICPPGTK